MNGTIYINGYIGQAPSEEEQQYWGGNVTMVDVVSQVKAQPDATAYNVIINSPGGSVKVGWDIYNYLKSLGLPLQTYGTGIVASIATVIFMAGQKRTVADNTRFMVHLPMGSIQNANSEQMEEYMAQLKKVENEMVKFYTESLGLTKEAVLPLLKDETWLDHKALVELGIVTEESPLKVAACADINLNTNKMNEKDTKTLFGELLAFLKGKAEPKNVVVYTATQEPVDFFELAEDASPSVGDKANVNGKPASGEITMADGNVYVFENGELVEIREAGMTEEEVMEELEAARKELQEKAEALEASQAKVAEIEQALKDKETKLEEATALLTRFQKLESKFVGMARKEGAGQQGRKSEPNKSRFGAALTQIKTAQRN